MPNTEANKRIGEVVAAWFMGATREILYGEMLG